MPYPDAVSGNAETIGDRTRSLFPGKVVAYLENQINGVTFRCILAIEDSQRAANAVARSKGHTHFIVDTTPRNLSL